MSTGHQDTQQKTLRGQLLPTPDDTATQRKAQSMLQNGQYSVWYRTPRGEGMGTITLCDGRVCGGDAMLGYSGSFEENGDQFKANVRTWRHTAGDSSVFGLDEVDIRLEGKSTAGITASCSGFARQLPDLPFEATLVRIPD